MNKNPLLLIFFLILSFPFITGCWDKLLLKDTNLIFLAGVDPTKDGSFESTVSIPVPAHAQGNLMQIVSGKGNTLRETREDIDTIVSGVIDSSKIKVVLINEELAATDLYAMLDLYYRDPRAPLSARVAITKVPAKELINLNIEGESLISDYYSELLLSAETRSIIPKLNIQFICPMMLDPGKDFILPHVNVNHTDNKRHARIIGTAMFNNKQYTGDLSLEESIMANLLNNALAETARLTVKISDKGEKKRAMDYITVQVEEIKREMQLTFEENLPQAKIILKLFLNVVEYPPDSLGDQATTTRLNEKLRQELTNLANTTMTKLQEARCDHLGFGREIIAYHHHAWDEKSWKDIYSAMNIEIDVQAEIIHHGIIN